MDQFVLLLGGIVFGYVVIRAAIALIAWIETLEDDE
jgi:hypothetical protein